MFRTEIKIQEAPFKIDHSSRILTFGSCFANVIGNKFHDNKFNALVNPFGTIFNPISLFSLIGFSLRNLVREDSFIEKDLWYSYDLHSDFSAASRNELKEKIVSINKTVSEFLRETNVITLTFGSAFIYRNIESKNTVANCHKIPGYNFNKELLTAEAIVSAFENLYNEIRTVNKNCKYILTVSPVRHLKDSIPLNAVSKSILRAACHAITEKFSDTIYFPSFEIMMDDLRDYRFYKADMIHPTEVAEDYIWDKFSEVFFTERTRDLSQRWTKVKKALLHKPFHPESSAYVAFQQETFEKLKELSKDINVESEILMLRKSMRD